MSESSIEAPLCDTSPLEPLSPEQVRVLGCLIEKEHTTPDYYPLTLNGLVTACNQSTNREPVVNYDERTVMEALESLKSRQFVYQVTMAGARVQKFKHNLERKFPWLEKPELALLTVMLLRGPQTVGELRARSERIQIFPDLPAVEAAVQKLVNNEHGMPLAVYFPPGAGRKSALYMHTLCGVPEAPTSGINVVLPLSSRPTEPADSEWKAKMEAEVAALRAEVAELRALLTT
ncbi:MAG: YceH family protein [Verrucomicrobiaceae bacterium]|nr:YceH family protein [Verrucomicrobiaceae bacterium]